MSTGEAPKRKLPQQPGKRPKPETFLKRVEALDEKIDEMSGELQQAEVKAQLLRDQVQQLESDKRRQVAKYLESLMQCEWVSEHHVKVMKRDSC